MCVCHLGELLDLVGIQVELLQGFLEAEDLFGNLLQAAVAVVQRGDRLLLTTQTPARHQPHQQTALRAHPHTHTHTLTHSLHHLRG